MHSKDNIFNLIFSKYNKINETSKLTSNITYIKLLLVFSSIPYYKTTRNHLKLSPSGFLKYNKRNI